jgi:hypothetical protein
MSLEDVRNRISTLEKKVRKRNLVGGFATVVVLFSCAYFAVVLPNVVERIGAVFTIVGAGYILYQLVLGKTQIRHFSDLQAQRETSFGFYRSELQRQRDFHRGLWLWSRLIIGAPGPLIFCIGMRIASASTAKTATIIAAILILEFIAAIPLNLRQARKYQHELDRLQSLGS